MKLTVIGCTGSFAGPRGAASSYLLEHEDAGGRVWRVLLDLGSGAFGPLQSVIDPAQLDAVVISHLHPDHYLDVTGLEVFWAYNARKDLHRLPIHAPDGLAARLRSAVGRDSDIPDGVGCMPFQHLPLQDGHRFTVGPLEFWARGVTHPVESYGFRVTTADEVFTYSGDTDECESLDALARDSDLFLCEAGYIEGRDDHFTGVHLSGRRAGRTAARVGVRRLVITHIPAWTDPRVPFAEASVEFTGPIVQAEPMAVLDVAAERQLQ